MKKLILMILLLIPINLLALDAIETYHPTYGITGNRENQTKVQASFKYGLIFPYDSGLYLSYTFLAHWMLYDLSSPFLDINHNPSVFWEKEDPFKYFDFIRAIPYEHKSNGRGGKDSRSVDMTCVEAQISYGDFINIGIREKITYYFNLSNQNKDYKRFKGNFETEIFAQIKSKHGFLGHERLSFKGEWTNKYYWYCIEFSCRIFTTKFRPHIYIQYYRGYGEFLLTYNKKSNALRAGFIFNPD